MANWWKSHLGKPHWCLSPQVPGKFGATLWSIDRGFSEILEFEAVEILKGLFNRFPLVKSEIISADGIKRARFRPMETTDDFTQAMNDVRAMFPALTGGGCQ